MLMASWLGRHHSAESRKKMSKSHIGKHLSAETRKKMSMSRSGKHLSEETRKKLSEKAKCRAPISDETKNKMSEKRIGRKWFTNGVDEIHQYECPGEGWARGRLKRK